MYPNSCPAGTQPSWNASASPETLEIGPTWAVESPVKVATRAAMRLGTQASADLSTASTDDIPRPAQAKIMEDCQIRMMGAMINSSALMNQFEKPEDPPGRNFSATVPGLRAR